MVDLMGFSRSRSDPYLSTAPIAALNRSYHFSAFTNRNERHLGIGRSYFRGLDRCDSSNIDCFVSNDITQKRYFHNVESSDGSDPQEPQDGGLADIGKTIDMLRDFLPSFAHQQIPSEILSPDISLSLFPTTLNLPVIHGSTAFHAMHKTLQLLLPILFVRDFEILTERSEYHGTDDSSVRATYMVKWQLISRLPLSDSSSSSRNDREDDGQSAGGLDNDREQVSSLAGWIYFDIGDSGKIVKVTIDRSANDPVDDEYKKPAIATALGKLGFSRGYYYKGKFHSDSRHDE